MLILSQQTIFFISKPLFEMGGGNMRGKNKLCYSPSAEQTLKKHSWEEGGGGSVPVPMACPKWGI